MCKEFAQLYFSIWEMIYLIFFADIQILFNREIRFWPPMLLLKYVSWFASRSVNDKYNRHSSQHLLYSFTNTSKLLKSAAEDCTEVKIRDFIVLASDVGLFLISVKFLLLIYPSYFSVNLTDISLSSSACVFFYTCKCLEPLFRSDTVYVFMSVFSAKYINKYFIFFTRPAVRKPTFYIFWIMQ